MLGPLRSWIPMETQAGKNPQVDAVGQFPTKKAASVLKPSQNLCGALGTLQCSNIYLCVGQVSVDSYPTLEAYFHFTHIVREVLEGSHVASEDSLPVAQHAQMAVAPQFPVQDATA